MKKEENQHKKEKIIQRERERERELDVNNFNCVLQSYEAKEVILPKETNKKQNELRELEEKFIQPGNLGYDHLVKMESGA